MLATWVTLGTADIDDIADAEASAAVVRAVKACYGADEWPEIARPLRDKVRQGQRDGLVDFLVSTGYVDNAEELFAWLLVDTEMSPCVLTSRIK